MCTGTRNDIRYQLVPLGCLFGSLFVCCWWSQSSHTDWLFGCWWWWSRILHRLVGLVVYCRGVSAHTPIGRLVGLVVVRLFIVVESNFAPIGCLVVCSIWAIDTLGTPATPVFLVQTIQTHLPIQLGAVQRCHVCHCFCC